VSRQGPIERRDPSALDTGVALGELLLEKYNNREALQVFREVLQEDDQHPRALLGLARSQHFDFSSQAVASTLKALELNPNLVLRAEYTRSIIDLVRGVTSAMRRAARDNDLFAIELGASF